MVIIINIITILLLRLFRMIGVTLEMSCSERTSCNYTITDLNPNTNYVIYISARRQGDTMDGPPGPSVYVKTDCAGMFPVM